MRVLLEEDGLLVVDKPPGLATTGRTLDDPDCLQYQLVQRYRRRIWAVHQLDTETSGVVLFVRRKALVALWAERLRRAEKSYLAVVHGAPQPPAGSIRAPIGYDESARRQRVCAEGKPATSHYRTLSSNPPASRVPASLLEVAIETGRTHQVRVHMAHLGHPLLGESRYREPPCGAHPRHALHAARITLAAADGGAAFSAPLPADLAALLTSLGLEPPPLT